MTAQAQTCGHRGSGWDAPGVYEVAEAVYRVPLPLPEEGLRAVNAYVLLDEDGPVLIDAGQATADSRAALDEALASLAVSASRVTRFLVTHIHRDHYTQAVAIRRAHDTSLALGADEKTSLELIADPANDRLRTQLSLLRTCGAGSLAAALSGQDDGVPVDLWEEPDQWLAGWARIGLARRTLTAVPTPGHTRGHLAFRDAEAGLLFGGDHVLPAITPSIGFEPDVPARPLADYLQSLRRVRTLPDTKLLPAHGPVTDSVHIRVDELLEHHAQRLESTYIAVRPDTETAAEVATRLAWTRHSRALHELSPWNQMLAVLETRAHLDVLVDQGRLRTCTDDDKVERYLRA